MFYFQTQYIYLHDALVDFIKCGNKSIDCTNFQKTFANICDAQPDEAVMSYIEEELDVSEIYIFQDSFFPVNDLILVVNFIFLL